jgi:hypothetical protein
MTTDPCVTLGGAVPSQTATSLSVTVSINSNACNSGGLSVPVIIGIVIGAVCLVAVVVLAIIGAYLHKKKNDAIFAKTRAILDNAGDYTEMR